MIEARDELTVAVAYHESAFKYTLGGAHAFHLTAFIIKDRGFVERTTVRDFEDAFFHQRTVRRECTDNIHWLEDIIRALDMIVPRWMAPRSRARPVRPELSAKRIKTTPS